VVVGLNALGTAHRTRHERRLERAVAALVPDHVLLGYRDTDERRFQKARLAVIPRPRIVTFGSSRVMLVSTGMVDAGPGQFYNAGLSGGSIEDHIVLWTVMRDSGKVPELALFAIDSWAFNTSYPEIRWLAWADDVNRFVDARESVPWASGLTQRFVYRWYQTKEMLSYAVLRSSLRDLQRTLAGHERRGRELLQLLDHQIVAESNVNGRRGLRADGSLVYEAAFQSRSAAEIRAEAVESLTKNRGGLGRFQWNSERAHRLRLLWADMRAQGVKIAAYLPPYHPAVWDGLSHDTAVQHAVQQTRHFLTETGQRLGVHVIDLSDPASVPCTETEFLDDLHGRESCVQRVVDRLLGERRMSSRPDAGRATLSP